LFRESVGADLAHADAVPPSAAHKSKLSHTTILIIFAVDHEELLSQTEYRSNAATTNMSRPVRANYLEIGHAM
jgi:hypothetical protein